MGIQVRCYTGSRGHCLFQWIVIFRVTFVGRKRKALANSTGGYPIWIVPPGLAARITTIRADIVAALHRLG